MAGVKSSGKTMRQIAFDLQRGPTTSWSGGREGVLLCKCPSVVETSKRVKPSPGTVCVCVLKQFPSAVQKTDNKLSILSLALTMLSIALALGIVQHCSKSH